MNTINIYDNSWLHATAKYSFLSGEPQDKGEDRRKSLS